MQAADLSPQEMKMKALEESITETAERCEELQQSWLRQQTHVVQLANQRNEHLHNINLLRRRKEVTRLLHIAACVSQ
jgi:hypothetical protein